MWQKKWGGTLHNVPHSVNFWGGTRFSASMVTPPVAQIAVLINLGLLLFTAQNTLQIRYT